MMREIEPIYYTYEYNRLTGIQYPINPDMNVRYGYGSPADGRNGAGRVVLREDGSGMEETVYGKLGEVTSNLRTFVVPFDDQSYSFRMHYTYDTWNRITRLTYPDGEEVVYRYDRGGNLKEMKGYGDSGENDYIRSIKYDKFGHRIEMGFGDGSISFYDYDVLLRLNRKYVRTSSGECLQDIAYDYDALDNITTIENSGGTLYGWLGGRYKYSFGYDYLNRMKSGEGSFTIDLAGSPSGESAGRTFTYRNELGYSKAGVIHHKQTHFSGYVQEEETREDRTYDYGYKDDRPNC